jgi:hypothetical protein
MSSITTARKVVRALCDLKGTSPTIFNDRLKDGTRSVKVLGWTYEDYMLARDALDDLNIRSTIVSFPSCFKSRGIQSRLHVPN